MIKNNRPEHSKPANSKELKSYMDNELGKSAGGIWKGLKISIEGNEGVDVDFDDE